MRKAWIAALLIGVLATHCEDAVPGETHHDAGKEAGIDATEAADATEDTLVVDAADAADATESATTPTFCDTTKPEPIFCDDFEALPFKGYWDNINRTPDLGEIGGGKLTLDDKLYEPSSPLHSAGMYTPPIVTTGVGASAILVKSIHAPPTDLMVRFDARIDTEYMPDGGSKLVAFASLHFVNKGWLFLYRSSVGTAFSVSVDGQGPGAVNVLSQPFEVGQWKNVRITVKNHPLDDATPEGDVLVGIDVTNAGQSPLPAIFQEADEIEVAVGPVAVGVIGEFRMNVDNVLFYDRSDL